MKRFRTCSLDQPFLLPPSLQDWLPEKHLARFIAEVVDSLDLSAIYSVYERKDNRGVVAYHPLMLTRLLLYGYAIGLTSSRRIEKATYDDLAFRFLAADQHPDHDTIANFRQEHLEALARLFVQALQLCRKAGLVKLGNVAIDGSKIKANASRHRGTTYRKLSEEEQRLRAIIDKLLAEASATDEQEDARFGKGNAGDDLPAELSSAQQRLERIRQAKQELEAEAKARFEQASKDYPARKPGPIPKQGATQEPLTADQKQVREKLKSRLTKARRAVKQPTRQYNLTDPDSRMMKDTAQRHLIFAYNAQAAVDSHSQIILGADLTQEATDHTMLLPMIEQVKQSMGQSPAVITADAGYWDTENVRNEAEKGTLLLVSPDGGKSKLDQPRFRNNAVMEAMRSLLKTETGGQLYRMRKAIIEPVFGHIKEQRGFRSFRLRGLRKVQGEWQLICLTHNLLKLYRHQWHPQTAG